MKKLLLLLCLLASPAFAQNWSAQGPQGGFAQPLVASSGNVAATAIGGSLTPTASRTAFLCGFTVTGAGATAASVIDITVGNFTGGAVFHYELVIPAGVTTSITPLIVNYNPCMPSTSIGSAISISVPSFGTGNTSASLTAWGYQW